MRPHSLFAAECACGAVIETETLEAKCPRCGIVIVLEFGVRHEISAKGEVRETR